MRTLAIRISHFAITYINYDTTMETVSDAVSKESEGSGRLLGYRSMNQKLRVEHGIRYPDTLCTT